MKLGVGIITCERFDYLEKCINSLYEHNPELKDLPLIIGDDGSCDEVWEKIEKKWPNAHVLHYLTRAGCSANINQVYKKAEELGLDYLYFSVNDFECVRKVDFTALIKFMDETPEAGQIQFVYWKGDVGDTKQARAGFNWTTREKLKVVKRFSVGKELLWEGNWSFVNLPSIARLNKVDICKGTIGLEGDGDKFHQKVELMWVKNWYDTGLKNYQADAYNQAFFGLDRGGNRTPGLKV